MLLPQIYIGSPLVVFVYLYRSKFIMRKSGSAEHCNKDDHAFLGKHTIYGYKKVGSSLTQCLVLPRWRVIVQSSVTSSQVIYATSAWRLEIAMAFSGMTKE
jgi:hypothetical protein